MTEATIKIRAKLSAGGADVKVLMNHPMETGQRKDPGSGKLLPAHFIRRVTATLNGKPVLAAQWGPAISRNPYLGLRLRGAKAGDRVGVAWEDNRGEKDAAEVVLA